MGPKTIPPPTHSGERIEPWRARAFPVVKDDTYTVTARFDNIGGLKPRAPVEGKATPQKVAVGWRGREWLERAAKKGDAAAAFKLAVILLDRQPEDAKAYLLDLLQGGGGSDYT